MRKITQIYDSLREEVRDYLSGKRNWRGEVHVRTLMIMVIENYCGINPRGVEAGRIEYFRYKKEMSQRKRWYQRVARGEATDTRRGIDGERRRLLGE